MFYIYVYIYKLCSILINLFKVLILFIIFNIYEFDIKIIQLLLFKLNYRTILVIIFINL